MELKELTTKVLALFEIEDVSMLSNRLKEAINTNDQKIYDGFVDLVDNRLEIDWLQKIYQYYLADRENKKQDYTPKTLALLVGALVGNADVLQDMCAGSGALTIQKWNDNHNQKFELYEIDDNVIPLLLFNLSVRNIESIVHKYDVLTAECFQSWKITKGEKYGKVTNI